MEAFISGTIAFVGLTSLVLIWIGWSRLDAGFRRPAMRGAWRWSGLFLLWCAAEQVIDSFYPIHVDPETLAWIGSMSLVQQVILLALIAPAFEELLFRGALFSALVNRWGIAAAAVLPSIGWGLLHTQDNAWYVASIAGSGVVLAIVRWKSGSIYPPFVLHALFNLYVTLVASPLSPPA